MLTGLAPAGHGIHENGRRLPDGIPVVTERLRGLGYNTAAFVSGYPLERQFGLARGFELYDDELGPGKVERSARETTDRALAWLAAADSRPRFLWVHYYDPHEPYAPPEPFRSRFPADPYQGEIAAMDHELARLLAAFEASPGGAGTRIIVAADLEDRLLQIYDVVGRAWPSLDELLARIRDIRSSEKVFWRKVLDLYATSIDYDPRVEASQRFFKTVQNKMHWAAHGQTAAEVIHARADAGLPFMGLQTTRPGGIIRKEDVSIAKNYLDGEELETLNRIVNAYIEFAELRALQRKVMTMREWIAKLDEFLKLSEHELLDHAGKISAEQAKMKAEQEYDRYRAVSYTHLTLPTSDLV